MSFATHSWKEPLRTHRGETTGFNDAHPEDQAAIANFYNFRHEHFVDINQDLGTDKIIDRLYLGSMADAAYLPMLLQLKVSHVVNTAAEAAEPYEAEDIGNGKEIKYLALGLRDSPEEAKLLQQKGKFTKLKKATAWIHNALSESDSNVVLVHCVQGVSRSSSLVVAYLMQYHQMPIDDAIALVKKQHPPALRPFRFQELIRGFHYHLQENPTKEA
eukprot:TRINITY_DN8775_c0_g1_i1.p1 TRINITY_DN8775_c0_g1~~TRINITY_DN8775_c0_g1_i1.p1  ORF type:complete len:216 (-),score=32.41 TRINITY_DN8775_c0_g1_i1:108-755(-)